MPLDDVVTVELRADVFSDLASVAFAAKHQGVASREPGSEYLQTHMYVRATSNLVEMWATDRHQIAVTSVRTATDVTVTAVVPIDDIRQVVRATKGSDSIITMRFGDINDTKIAHRVEFEYDRDDAANPSFPDSPFPRCADQSSTRRALTAHCYKWPDLRFPEELRLGAQYVAKTSMKLNAISLTNVVQLCPSSRKDQPPIEFRFLASVNMVEAMGGSETTPVTWWYGVMGLRQ
ncbi:MAG: hypothetical protein WCP28_11715 [Actinomycetes bacterium]